VKVSSHVSLVPVEQQMSQVAIHVISQNSVSQNWYVQVIILAVSKLLLSMQPVLHQINVTHDSSVALSVIPVKKYVDLVPSELKMIDAGIRQISQDSISGEEELMDIRIDPIQLQIV